MRLFTLILAFLILAMAIMPCSDELYSDSKTASELTHKTSDQKDEPSNCSAFCNCARCVSSVLLPETAALPAVSYISIVYSDINICYSPDSSGSVWQPPQLS